MGQLSTGMNTTPGMWEMVSEALADAGAKLPTPVNEAIYALCNGRATVGQWVDFKERMPTEHHPIELLCCEETGESFMYGWYIDEGERLANGELRSWLDIDYSPPNAVLSGSGAATDQNSEGLSPESA